MIRSSTQSLWAIAWDGEEVAGFSLNRYRMGIGWIRTLGVRRPWRKRGLGEALLLHSFGEYYRRGMQDDRSGCECRQSHRSHATVSEGWHASCQ